MEEGKDDDNDATNASALQPNLKKHKTNETPAIGTPHRSPRNNEASQKNNSEAE